jgi:hypothetical protein
MLTLQYHTEPQVHSYIFDRYGQLATKSLVVFYPTSDKKSSLIMAVLCLRRPADCPPVHHPPRDLRVIQLDSWGSSNISSLGFKL